MYRIDYGSEFLKKHGNFFIEHTSIEADSGYHTNPHMMLIYVAHASHYCGRFICGNNSVELRDKDILLINPNATFSAYSFDFSKDKRRKNDGAIGVYACSFTDDYLQTPLDSFKSDFPFVADFIDRKTPYLYTHDTNDLFVRTLILHCLDDFSYSQPFAEQSVKNLIMLALINVFRIYCATQNMNIEENSNLIIGHAENYIRKHIHYKISLSDLSDILKVTPRHLCRLFKKYVGMSFTEYTNRLRVEKIKDDLKSVDRPLQLIYDDFEHSPQHLNNIFKEYTGYSIYEYKKRFNYKENNPLYKNK